jgi:hypothetical protein
VKRTSAIAERTLLDADGPPVGIYGSEGWGFESLRARTIIRGVTCGHGGVASLVVCPVWTVGVRWVPLECHHAA